MSKTSVVIVVGVLTAGVILAVYLHFGTEGTQDQTPAAGNQAGVRLGEQRSAAAPESTAPREFTDRTPIVPSSPPLAADSAPAHRIRRPRTSATQHFMLPAHSGTAQKSSTQAAEPTAFSKAEQNSQATQSPSDVASQSKPAQTSAVLQPPASSPPAVVPPLSSGEQRSQAPDSSSEVATQNKPSAATAVLQPPSSPSPTFLPVQPVAAPFAMLHATRKILLNGKLSDDSVIVSGESIETPPDTYATLVREKSEVLIRPSSRLRITEKGVELERGEVLVTTTTGLSVQANRWTITPRPDGRAKYEVLDIAESPQVKTYEGSVLVKD